MVYFKITNGVETRKFQVTPGELTFQQLKERIDTLFPEDTKEAANLVLRYCDAEGDVITLSSDEEFQEVLSNLPENHVWKLHLTPPAVKRQQREARPFLLDHHLEPSSWQLGRSPLSEVEELIDLFFGLPGTTTSSKSGEKDTPSAEGKQQSQGNDSAETESQERAEGGSSDGASPKEGEGEEEEVKSKLSGNEGEEEEVKSKLSGSEEEVKSKESLPKCPVGHCYRVKRVGLWDPFLLGGYGLFSPSSYRVFSAPVGYHVTWRPRTCSSATCA